MTASSGADSGTVTVLFADLVGSTAQRVQLGEDAADVARRLTDRLLRDVTEAHHGRVVKGTGDGIMATFSSASHAVSAAVGILAAIDTDRDGPVPQAMRIGISAGDVTWDEGDCFGLPVVEAARLCDRAGSGQILVADVVRVLARDRGGHTFVSVGELELKGLAPLSTYEVTWVVEDQPGDEVSALPRELRRGKSLAFTGRTSELDSATDALAEAVRGRAQLLLLAGEPGIGKTRLAGEVAQVALEQGGSVLYGRCDEDAGLPHQPFSEALQRFVETHAPRVLRRDLGHRAGELTRLCPDLANLVPGLAPPSSADPETQRFQLYDAVADWLGHAPNASATVLVLDDLHWATVPTLMLLRHVLRRSADARLLVIGTYRDTELGRTHPLAEMLADWRRTEAVSRISLAGLDRSAVASLVEADDGDLADRVYDETEGNPFFVTEILQHLRDHGALANGDEGSIDRARLDEIGIPEGIREVLGRRFSRLSPECNAALTVAAIMGPEFDLASIAQAESQDPEVVSLALDEGVHAGVVDELDVGAYRFSHALIRSTLIDELTLTRRVQLHRKIGLALELTRPDDVLALAYHFQQAVVVGEAERAARYGVDAAHRALDGFAAEQARDLAAAALEAMDSLEDDLLRCDLLLCLGAAQKMLGIGAHRETLLAAAALAMELGEGPRLVEAATRNVGGIADVSGADDDRIEVMEAALVVAGDATAERARLLAALGHELSDRADPRRFGLLDEALAIARQVDDVGALSFVLHERNDQLLGVPHLLDVRLAETVENLALAERLGDPLSLGFALQDRAAALGQSGDLSETRELYERIGLIDEEHGFGVFKRADALMRTFFALLDGRLGDAEALANDALEVMVSTGHRSATAFYAAQLAAIRLDQGRVAEIEPLVAQAVADDPTFVAWRCFLALLYKELDRGVEAIETLAPLAADGFDGVPYDAFWLQSMCMCAEVNAWLDDRASASALHEQLKPFADQMVFVVTCQGATARFVAMLAHTMGRLDESDELFAIASELESRCGAVSCLARTNIEWARLLIARSHDGDADRARSLIEAGLATARSVGLPTVERAALDLQQAVEAPN